MEPIELSPMAMIQAQREKIVALTEENMQLHAAVLQLQQALNSEAETTRAPGPGDNPLVDVTDEVVGAEVST